MKTRNHITFGKNSGILVAVLLLALGFTTNLRAQTSAELWDAPSSGEPVGTAITNVTLPLGRCTTNSCGNFDWMGNVTLTNGINPNETQRHFTVSVP
jgi:hypothetical protein